MCACVWCLVSAMAGDSKLRKLAASAKTADGTKASVVSRDSFNVLLKDMLKRLAVVPATATAATELLDARAAARQQCNALMKTAKGRARVDELIASLEPTGSCAR